MINEDFFKSFEKKRNYTKYIFLSFLLVVTVYFLFTLNRVYTQSKEINCITYYTSLGYTANGCDSIVERFTNNND